MFNKCNNFLHSNLLSCICWKCQVEKCFHLQEMYNFLLDIATCYLRCPWGMKILSIRFVVVCVAIIGIGTVLLTCNL